MALLVFAPATWLASAIASGTQGRVLMTEPRGSIWSGTSGLILAGGEGSAGAVSLPSQISWRISPRWAAIQIQLQADCCTPAAPLELGITLQGLQNLTMTLAATPFEVPARMLSGLGAPWNTLQLDGALSLSTQNLTTYWSAAQGLVQLTGQARLDAQSIETALSTVRPLGSYRVSLAGSTIRLETVDTTNESEPAALILTGAGEWTVQANGQNKAGFQGEALAAAGREAALINLIHIIGQRQPSPDGRIRATLSLGQVL